MRGRIAALVQLKSELIPWFFNAVPAWRLVEGRRHLDNGSMAIGGSHARARHC
jgi:hypothetical protein